MKAVLHANFGIRVHSIKMQCTTNLTHREENSAVKCSKASASFSLFSGTEKKQIKFWPRVRVDAI